MKKSGSSTPQWEQNFAKLAAFHENHGHLRIPKQGPQYRELVKWLCKQVLRHESLGQDQIQKLLRLGVYFGRFHTAWYERYFELVASTARRKKAPQHRSPLARWLEYQRTLKHQGKLSLQRTRWLNALGVVWKTDIFAERLEELKAFHAVHGHCNVPFDYPENIPLGHYVGKLRRTRHKRPLHQVQALNALGFSWTPREGIWEKRFAELKEFLAKHHTFPILSTDRFLAYWMRSQRTNPPSPERRALLDEIGFPWNPLEERWTAKYLELKAFHKRHGHSHVPTRRPEYEQLWKWLHFQKTQRAKLTLKRRKLMDELGVKWDIEDRISPTDRLQQLKRFHAEHGHCNVTIPDDKDLATWLGGLRRRQKRLPRELRQELERMGINWTPRASTWQKSFAKIAAFKKQHGRHITWDDDKTLGTWLYDQRRRWYRLTEEQRQKLVEIGLTPSNKPLNPKGGRARKPA